MFAAVYGVSCGDASSSLRRRPVRPSLPLRRRPRPPRRLPPRRRALHRSPRIRPPRRSSGARRAEPGGLRRRPVAGGSDARGLRRGTPGGGPEAAERRRTEGGGRGAGGGPTGRRGADRGGDHVSGAGEHAGRHPVRQNLSGGGRSTDEQADVQLSHVQVQHQLRYLLHQFDFYLRDREQAVVSLAHGGESVWEETYGSEQGAGAVYYQNWEGLFQRAAAAHHDVHDGKYDGNDGRDGRDGHVDIHPNKQWVVLLAHGGGSVVVIVDECQFRLVIDIVLDL
mmetsp:Transcript_42063/g.98564  ORF Transcript_42063/g.98564 Transcript_42063/m.98564 type:complete len:281 (+) Transcript_42063:277-1119(+)